MFTDIPYDSPGKKYFNFLNKAKRQLPKQYKNSEPNKQNISIQYLTNLC